MRAPRIQSEVSIKQIKVQYIHNLVNIIFAYFDIEKLAYYLHVSFIPPHVDGGAIVCA